MADGRTVALVGVQDFVVIETADAVFVCPKARAEDVRQIVRQLQEQGASELL
jgi:mannose-1-phosphate guanylyltransferase